MIDTVIFDMDGTLIDTEKYYRRAWPEAMRKFGYEMTDERYLSIRSLGKPYSTKQFKEWYGEDFDSTEIIKYRNVLFAECLEKEGLNLKPGVLKLLEYLKEKNIKIAIATATDMERTQKFLTQLGIINYFDKIISAKMVENGKPSPDVYLYACKMIEKDPKECFAVEDSPNGVLSAYRAGCNVIMIPDLSEPDEETSKLLYKKFDTIDKICELF